MAYYERSEAPRQMRPAKSKQNLKYCMWMLNLFFFAVIFAAIRTGDLWTIIPISALFMLLHHWLAETEQNGTIHNTERPSSHDNNHIHWVLDDTHSDMDNSKT